MTYETISVRMNRSDRNIRWGFSVRQQADGLIIDRVEAESLSDKAGVKHNDKVDQINGRSTRGLDASTANRLIDDSFNEVRLSLQRFVTSHTCLPWTLNEKDNKMVVEDMKPGFGSGFGSGFGGNSSFNQNTFGSHFGTGSGVNRNITNTNTSSSNHQSSTFHSSSHNTSGNFGGAGGFSPSSHHNIPIRHSPAPPFSHNLASNNSYSSNIKKSTDNNILPGSATYNPGSGSNYNSTPAGFGASSGGYKGGYSNGAIPAPAPTQAPPSTYSYNNGATNQSYGQGAGGTPLNQLTFINTAPAPGGGIGAQGGLSPSKVFYHSPSGRNRNDLSPGASVHHLQYNSPMNLYSSEATAEQLYQQTGLTPEGPVPHDKTPAYLTSETRKLIEEEARGRFQRGKSPSSQSSCFKRIAHAVGADH
ncbi:hypothetical protein GCK72_004781 [Caenorhabditis remanei]|uniref:PDZ domain-containing protein n=1 Tax=Caenorhabditis remanei TaxID=31234 RepID=A0A6A5HD39_CAERE|nr:hypothetical protein GCK72_004781 [Caenorhabditis remanei]KAF1764831.1 hypothetical protein GCK72_004781 [Caenorhabditis remanei]